MKRLLRIVRPIALEGIATGIFVAQLWFLFLWYDECASRFVLSEKVQSLHRILTGLAVVQWLILSILIWILETVMIKQRTPELAEQGAPPNSAPRLPCDAN